MPSTKKNHPADAPSRPTNAEHPAMLGSFWNWIRLLCTHRSVDRSFVPRALFVALTTLATSPLRTWERVRYGHAIRRTPIDPRPVFIIGHWRSGTTHLLNLLALDETLGSLTTFQAMAPGFCLTGDGAVKRFIARQAAARYPTRLIDNIPLAFDAPQEDEFGLANLSPHAFIHTFSFPRQADEIFARSVLFDGLSPAQRARWIETYLYLLRTTTRACGGRRLIVKNCAHTARIPMLLDLFPDARFVHIHRNPYEVYLSTLHMHRTVLPRSQLQDADPARIETNVLRFYTLLMERFLEQRMLIPSGNLVEMRFTDLETEPIEQLRRIYDKLGLSGFSDAEPAFRSYLDSIAGYRKNAYTLSPEAIETVNRHWPYAFDEWGYRRLDPVDA